MFFVKAEMRERSRFFDRTVEDLAADLDLVRNTRSATLATMIPAKIQQLTQLKLVNQQHNNLLIPKADKFGTGIPVAIQRPAESLRITGDYMALHPEQRLHAIAQLTSMSTDVGVPDKIALIVAKTCVEDFEKSSDRNGYMNLPFNAYTLGFTGSLNSLLSRKAVFPEDGSSDRQSMFLAARPLVTLLLDHSIADRDITLFHELVHVDQQIAMPVVPEDWYAVEASANPWEQAAREMTGRLVLKLLLEGKELDHTLAQFS